MGTTSLERDAFLRLLGEVPAAPPPLAPERLERADLGDVLREKVTYAVEAGERVPAFLFLPKHGAPPFPAVLVHHAHAMQYHVGKDGPAGLAPAHDPPYAPELARRGYAALVPDALCFNERRDPGGLLKASAYEKFEAMTRIAEGRTLPGKFVWDARRALDYLETRPEVDRARLGMIGHSLGGQQTLFTAAADVRVRAAAASCGFASYGAIRRHRINHSFAVFVPNLERHGGIGAVLALVAPRPFLVVARTADSIFPFDGIGESVAAGREAYAAGGAADRLGTFFEAGEHAFSDAMREASYSWLDRWLKPAPPRA
jgi:dienelactone hydrolase